MDTQEKTIGIVFMLLVASMSLLESFWQYRKKIMNRLYYYILLLFVFGGIVSCDSSDEETAYDCWHKLYFETSAVCSVSIQDAALVDNQGNVFIAKDFFAHISRDETTIGDEFEADFKSVSEPDQHISCGALIDAPFVELLCIRKSE